jgi:hypothetical protein
MIIFHHSISLKEKELEKLLNLRLATRTLPCSMNKKAHKMRPVIIANE